jgi:imidazoleglycerol-phosphate dehydratase/histidinol-phosphatase
MVSNQDGLGTDSFPSNTFWPIQNFIISTLEGEGIFFDNICIDNSFPEDNSPNRKPGIGMLTKYLNGNYDLENSIVIGDRLTDIELAKNLGACAIRINGRGPISDELQPYVLLDTNNWYDIKSYLLNKDRKAKSNRITTETNISASINLDGKGYSQINTGLGFFDHMLQQIAKHGEIDLYITTKGDLHIDEHHTIEDTAIVLGKLIDTALGKKAGIDRYGFALPMDDANAQVLLDFGGRPWLVWDVNFKREKIGDVPTELFFHFFKTFADHAKCNLNIRASGDNEHHLIESVFKTFAKTILMAKRRNGSNNIPSTKGSLS